MHPTAPADWRPVAFKEWQLVSDAIVAGEQAEQVAPMADGTLRSFKPREGLAEDDIVFSVYLETIASGRITDWDEVLRLAPYHIWREEIVRERFEWGDEPGISWATIRAWKLDEPWILKDRATFGGCRSWFGMPTDEGGDWRARLEGSRMVEPSCGLPDWLI